MAAIAPLESENTAAIAAMATLQAAGIEANIELEIHKGLPCVPVSAVLQPARRRRRTQPISSSVLP